MPKSNAVERPPASSQDDGFELWDLRVTVVGTQADMVCDHTVGDWFEVSGENLLLPPHQPFSMYALAALLPLLPAKQRITEPTDWMSTDAEVACPDPHCGARFRIQRTRRRGFRHSEVTRVPLHQPDQADQPEGAEEVAAPKSVQATPRAAR